MEKIMSNLKYKPKSEDIMRDIKLIKTMETYRDAMGITNWRKIAPLCGFREGTFSSRVAHPGNFTRDEMSRVIKALHIPDSEIRPYL